LVALKIKCSTWQMVVLLREGVIGFGGRMEGSPSDENTDPQIVIKMTESGAMTPGGNRKITLTGGRRPGAGGRGDANRLEALPPVRRSTNTKG